MILLAGLAGLFYTLQNTFEKTIFNNPKNNVNDYFLIRLCFMVLIFGFMYFVFPRFTNSISSTKLDLINYIKNNLWLTILSASCVVVSVYFMSFGLSKYDISTFTPVYMIIYLILNVLSGIIIFKDVFTLKKMIGLAFAIVSIILFNLK